MSFKRRLRNVCLFLLAVLLLLFGLTTTTAYMQGYIQPTQFAALIYIAAVLIVAYAYLVIHWRN